MTGVSAPRALRVAHIDTTHGRRGEVSAVLLTDFPERFESLEEVRVGRNADGPTCRRTRGEVIDSPGRRTQPEVRSVL